MSPAPRAVSAPADQQVAKGGSTQRSIARAIEHTNFNRRGIASWRTPGTFKEWLHFCVYAPGLDLLANFSLVDDVHADGGRKARTILLARADRWRGVVRPESLGSCEMEGGAVGVRFGDNAARFRDGSYELCLNDPTLDLQANLSLAPVTFPAPVYNVQVPGGPPIHWAVVPRLRANGTVRLAGTTHVLRDAPAYHDHDWGDFRWGDDFAWEWGYCLPPAESCPFSLVVVRLSNRARGVVLAQALFVWRNGRQWRFFRGHEARAQRQGLLRPAEVLKLPAPMALLRPSMTTDVPECFAMDAAADGDHVNLRFHCEDVAQVIIPNDGRPGTTIIHEVKGHFEVRGQIRGEALHIDGGGVFEFLGR